MPLTCRSSIVVAAFLASSFFCGCVAPRQSPALAVKESRSDTGTIVATKGDDITVLIANKLVKIRLEGFAREGTNVAAAVRNSPAYARLEEP